MWKSEEGKKKSLTVYVTGGRTDARYVVYEKCVEIYPQTQVFSGRSISGFGTAQNNQDMGTEIHVHIGKENS